MQANIHQQRPKNMNIVITGGSKGMGKAIAEKFAAVGHHIFITARNEEMLKATAQELEQKFPDCHCSFVSADLSTPEGIQVFTTYMLNQDSPADVLVNNAGSFLPGSIWNEEEGTLEKMMAVNLYSAYHITRAFLPEMMKKKSGHIFNMCSIAALQAYSNGGSYSISKFALAGFSKNLREELKPYNIKVTALYPGAVFTSTWAEGGISPDRIMEVNDVASLVYTTSQLSPQACVEDIILRPQAGDLP